MVKGRAKSQVQPQIQGRGKGRARGRPRKEPIAVFGSTIGACIQPQQEQNGIKDNTPGEDGGRTSKDGFSSSGVVKRLQLTPPQLSLTPNEIVQTEEGLEINGTVELSYEMVREEADPAAHNQQSTTSQKGKEKLQSETPIWTNLFRNNRSATSGMTLNYIPPQVLDGQLVAQLEKNEVEPEIQKWKCALIAYFLGATPGYNVMCRYISTNWKNIADPEVFLHDEGYYIIKFQSIEDMQAIYYTGPYSLNNRPIILKQWTPNFDFSVEFPTEIPLWVIFPKLPMNYWGCGSLSRIASLVGNPIYADECTSKQTRISYARMLIEVNVTKPLPTVITIVDPNGGQYEQEVDYDWRPYFCEQCMVVGHKCPPKAEKQLDVQQEKPPKRKRPLKTVTQEWKHKGPIKEHPLPTEDTTNQPMQVTSQVQAQTPEKQATVPIQQQSQMQSDQHLVGDSLNLSHFPALSKPNTLVKNYYSPLSKSGSDALNRPPEARSLPTTV